MTDRDQLAAILREHAMPSREPDYPADEYECCADAVIEAGWRPPQPTAVQLRAYLKSTGWLPNPSGPAGRMWTKGDARIGLAHDADGVFVDAMLRRIAEAEGRDVETVAAAVRAGQEPLDADASPLLNARLGDVLIHAHELPPAETCARGLVHTCACGAEFVRAGLLNWRPVEDSDA